MKLVKKDSRLVPTYVWETGGGVTRDDCDEILMAFAKIGELGSVRLQGYHDMDTHENQVSFKSVDELKKGKKKIEDIEADEAEADATVGGEQISLGMSHYGDSKKGIKVWAICVNEDALKRLNSIFRKLDV